MHPFSLQPWWKGIVIVAYAKIGMSYKITLCLSNSFAWSKTLVTFLVNNERGGLSKWRIVLGIFTKIWILKLRNQSFVQKIFYLKCDSFLTKNDSLFVTFRLKSKISWHCQNRGFVEMVEMFSQRGREFQPDRWRHHFLRAWGFPSRSRAMQRQEYDETLSVSPCFLLST